MVANYRQIVASQNRPNESMIPLILGMKEFIFNPALFVRKVLGGEPDPWQEKALLKLGTNPREAISSGHGVGKTAFLSWVVWWFLATRPMARIPCTAPTRQQLFDILWPELSKWQEKSPLLKANFEWQKTRIINKQFPERWFATARTSNKPENLAGFHEDHILFVVDEASGVADEIFEVIEGALTTYDAKLVLCGNPTQTSGVFYDAVFGQDTSLYKSMTVSCYDSPRVTEQYINTLKAKYHEDSDVFRVRVQGLPPRMGLYSFIPLEFVEKAMMLDLEPVADIFRLGVDVARFGDDETVLAPKVGPRVFELQAYAKQDLDETARQCLRTTRTYCKRYSLKRAELCVDETGVGGGVVDILNKIIREEKLPYKVIPCNNGAAAHDKVHFADWGTEQYDLFRDSIRLGQLQLPDDDELRGQLTNRRYDHLPKGQLKLEPKKQMKARGLPSPDRADAVVLANCRPTKRILRGKISKPKGF